MSRARKELYPSDVRVGQVWQANRFAVGPDRLNESAAARKLRGQLRRYGLRFKIVAMRFPHAIVENCFGPKNRRSIRLDRFDNTKKGYTRIGA